MGAFLLLSWEHLCQRRLSTVGPFFFPQARGAEIISPHHQEFAVVPNKNGVLSKVSDLYIDEIQDDNLLSVLRYLGDDWNNILIHNSIYVECCERKKTKDDIATKIERLLKSDAADVDQRTAIILLTEWLDSNPEMAKDLFSALYVKRAELFMNTIEDKESLYQIMKLTPNLAELTEVAKKLNEGSIIAENPEDIKVEITAEILAGLNVTSIEELERLIEDKQLSSIFLHTSIPTVEMFARAQKLRERAIENVKNHLTAHPEYNCDDWEEVAPTIYGGVTKGGVEIFLVIRPSDNNEVIIFYESEPDTLEDINSELWIDNGCDQPKLLTLGKILKATGINRIPL